MIRRILMMATFCLVSDMTWAASTAIINARAVTMTDRNTIENATILIRDGRIEDIGQGLDISSDARIIDAGGRMVTPGLMNAATRLGLTEVSSNAHTNDQSISSGEFGAGFDIQYAINPNSVLIPQARADGLTWAAIMPGGSAVPPFQGMGAILRLAEGYDILYRSKTAVYAKVGGTAASDVGGSRAAQWLILRHSLDKVKSALAEDKEKGAASISDVNNKALAEVVKKNIPLVIDARRESDIRQAINLQNDYDIRVIIYNGSDAWRVAPMLARAGIPVILDGAANVPFYYDEIGARADAAAILHKAGVLLAIVPSPGIHLSYNAGLGAREATGLAVSNGLPYEAGLRALTMNVARMWRVDKDFGSLKKGKVADIVVWDGDPLEPFSAPAIVLVGGHQVSLATRQTKLRDRYLPTVQEGAWPAAYR